MMYDIKYLSTITVCVCVCLCVCVCVPVPFLPLSSNILEQFKGENSSIQFQATVHHFIEIEARIQAAITHIYNY